MPAAWQNSSWTTQVFQSVCPFRQVDAVFGPVFVCGHVLLPPFRSRRTAVLGGCKWSIIMLSLFVRATCPSLRASGVSCFSDVVTLEDNSSDTGKRLAKHSTDSFLPHFCGFFSCFSYFSGLFWTFWMLVHDAHRTLARHNTAPDTHSTQDSNTWHATQINTPPHTAHIHHNSSADVTHHSAHITHHNTHTHTHTHTHFLFLQLRLCLEYEQKPRRIRTLWSQFLILRIRQGVGGCVLPQKLAAFGRS